MAWRVKNSPAMQETGDGGSIPELGRSSGGGNGNLLQYSCLKNPINRRAWWATVHREAKVYYKLESRFYRHSR